MLAFLVIFDRCVPKFSLLSIVTPSTFYNIHSLRPIAGCHACLPRYLRWNATLTTHVNTLPTIARHLHHPRQHTTQVGMPPTQPTLPGYPR